MKKIIFLFALIISNVAISQNSWSPIKGEIAKNFSLNTIMGKELSLSSITEDNPVVLVVLRGWPGYQCPICTRQVGELISAADEFKKYNVAVLMVYPGPSEQLTEHAKDFKEDFDFPPNYHFAVDPDYSMVNLYGLRWDANRETAYPSTFVINKDGKIVFSKISDSHGGRVNVEEVIEILEKL